MTTSNDELETRLRGLSDEELQRRLAGGSFTEQAQALAVAELRLRGAAVPALPEPADADAIAPQLTAEDMVPLARLLEPMEAGLMQSFLLAQGIDAVMADAHLVQANALIFYALGGVRMLVPASQLAQATELIAARDRGEFQLSDDEDAPRADA
jgi:hypothetical protein